MKQITGLVFHTLTLLFDVTAMAPPLTPELLVNSECKNLTPESTRWSAVPLFIWNLLWSREIWSLTSKVCSSFCRVNSPSTHATLHLREKVLEKVLFQFLSGMCRWLADVVETVRLCYRRVSHGLGWPAKATLFLPIVMIKGNQTLQNTSAPTASASNIAHQAN